MIWRTLKASELAGYPHHIEVRSISIAEYRSLETLSEVERQDWCLQYCAKIDGLPVLPSAVDMHVAIAIIQGVMANPWSGPQQTESNGC